MADTYTKPTGKEAEQLLVTARKRFKLAMDAESDNRSRWREDIRFRAGYQWPEALRARRERDPRGPRPCLTINKMGAHVAQVVNDMRQNRAGVRVHPVDDVADPETAKVFQGLVRHIERNSNADVAYDTAGDTTVTAGIGYVRVIQDYEVMGVDQELQLLRVLNPMSIYMDPRATQRDASDARWAFCTENMDREEFRAMYPNAQLVSWKDLAEGDPRRSWMGEDDLIIADYYHIEEKDDAVLLLSDGTNRQMMVWASIFEDPDLAQRFIGLEVVRERDAKRRCCYWDKINGFEVLESTEFPSQYIPIARMVGEEIDIEGELLVKGMVRDASDAQRAMNYWRSCMTELIALAPKAPWVVPFGAITGFEDQWAASNTDNVPYLYYLTRDSEGNEIRQAPQRQGMPQVPTGIMQALLTSEDDLKATTRQFDASLGRQSNETSGKAILARQREGDTGNFHFIANQAVCIRHVGRILVDAIPRVYDTARIVRVLGEDGTENSAQLDPMQPVSMRKEEDVNGKIRRIYNLGVGRYDVSVSAGPSYTTKRQEAADSMTQILAANESLWTIIGDLAIKNMDWPGSDEMAKRLNAVVPPEVKAATQTDEERAQAQQQGNPAQAVVDRAQMLIDEIQGKAQQAIGELQQQLVQEQQNAAELQQKLELAKQDAAARMYEADVRRYEADAKVQEAQIKAEIEHAKAAATLAQQQQQPFSIEEVLSQVRAQFQQAPDGQRDTRPVVVNVNGNEVQVEDEQQEEPPKPRVQVVTLEAPSGQVYRGTIEERV